MEYVLEDQPAKPVDTSLATPHQVSSKDYISSPASQRVLKQMTLSVKDLYVHIHKLSSKKSKQSLLKHGELLNQGRYVVHKLIGKGAFGEVVEAFDKARGETVAIKIIKRITPLNEHAEREIATLKLLNEVDSEKGFIVRVIDSFKWNGHTCIVFEYLAKTLYQLLRETNYKGLPLTHIRIFAWQLFSALILLSLPSIRVIHCDLKPENIMLKSSDKFGIKVVDFGSSSRVEQKKYRYVQSRYYRAPEVLLELNYGQPIDVWSLACILVELHVGQPLFCGCNKVDQMAKIIELMGMPPAYIIEKSPKAREYFVKRDHKYELKVPPVQKKEEASKAKSLADLLGVYSGGPRGQWESDPDHSVQKYLNFLDLIERMLQFDPDRRITPYEALRHRFFEDGNSTGGHKFLVPRISNPSSALVPEGTAKRRPNSYRQDKQNPPPWPEHYYPITKNAPKTKRRPSIPATKYMMSPIFPQKLDDYSSQDTSPLSKQSTEVCSSLYHSPMRDSTETEEGKSSGSGQVMPSGAKNRPSSFGVRADRFA